MNRFSGVESTASELTSRCQMQLEIAFKGDRVVACAALERGDMREFTPGRFPRLVRLPNNVVLHKPTKSKVKDQ